MTGRESPWVGRRLMAVRQVQVEGPSGSDNRGDVELVWDDRSVMLITNLGGTVTAAYRQWKNSEKSRAGQSRAQENVADLRPSVTRDISRTLEFGRFIGQVLQDVEWAFNEAGEPIGVELTFDIGGVRVRAQGRGIYLQAEPRRPIVRYSHVAFPPARDNDPEHLYCEAVDGVERRRVAVWRDGRRGWASTFVGSGGSVIGTGRITTQAAINRDTQAHAKAMMRRGSRTSGRSRLLPPPQRPYGGPRGLRNWA